MEESSIELEVINRYQNNLNYFQEKHPELFKKINLLNIAMSNGMYQEKYTLEYKDEGYFDVLDNKSGDYLYNQNSLDHSKKFAKKMSFKKDENVIETFHQTAIQESKNPFNKFGSPQSGPLYATAQLIKYTSTFASDKTTMKKIDKFIFFGVGLGLHLVEVQKKIQAYNLYIIEEDLELFRLSMFMIDYQSLSTRAKLVFSVMEDKSAQKESFQEFFVEAYNYNHYLKYAIFSDNYTQNIKFLQDFIVTQDYISHPYNRFLSQLLKSPEYLVENYKYIDIKTKHEDTPLSKKPALLIAAGPSLDKNREWLKKNHKKFMIISVLAAVPSLYKFGIKPDIVTSMDPSPILVKFFENIDVENFLDKTIFLLSSVSHRDVINFIPRDNLYFFESTTNYKIDFGSLTAPSIGESTYGLSLILGVGELYLLGLDLALDAKTKSTHSESHFGSKVLSSNDVDSENSIYYTDLGKTISYVKGNFLSKVPTTPLYKTSANSFSLVSKLYKRDNQKVYNLNDGAFLDGATPLMADKIDVDYLENLKNVDIVLKDFFDDISDCINIKDVKYLEKQVAEVKRLQTVIVQHKKSVSRTLVSAYLKSYASLIHELLGISNKKNSDINAVFYYYSRYISTFIFDFFNTKELNNPKKHIKKIDSILITQIEKILNLYLTTMEIYLEYANRALEEKEELV